MNVFTLWGFDRLRGATHNIIPDRIETGTYLCAATAVGGAIYSSKTPV